MSDLRKEFQYYLKHQDDLIKEYEGKVLVIKDCEVIGAFQTTPQAVDEAVKMGHEKGTFLVQKCTPGNEDYTAVFHSRVA